MMSKLMLVLLLVAVPIAEAAEVPDNQWMPWMLGIFGAIISALFLVLISMIKAGFNKIEERVTKVEEVQQNHTLEIELIKRDTDPDRLAETFISKLRAAGGYGFDQNHFKGQ